MYSSTVAKGLRGSRTAFARGSAPPFPAEIAAGLSTAHADSQGIVFANLGLLINRDKNNGRNLNFEFRQRESRTAASTTAAGAIHVFEVII